MCTNVSDILVAKIWQREREQSWAIIWGWRVNKSSPWDIKLEYPPLGRDGFMYNINISIYIYIMYIMYIISSCWCLPDFTGTALVFFGIDKTRVTKVYNTALPTLRHRWSNIAQWCICAYIWNTSATSHGTSPVQTVARLKSLHHEMNFQIEVISAVDQSGEHLRRDHKRVLSAQCRDVQVWTIWYRKYQYISMCTCTIHMIWCMNRVGYNLHHFVQVKIRQFRWVAKSHPGSLWQCLGPRLIVPGWNRWWSQPSVTSHGSPSVASWCGMSR
jgi:hypothetical protein